MKAYMDIIARIEAVFVDTGRGMLSIQLHSSDALMTSCLRLMVAEEQLADIISAIDTDDLPSDWKCILMECAATHARRMRDIRVAIEASVPDRALKLLKEASRTISWNSQAANNRARQAQIKAAVEAAKGDTSS